MLSLTNTVCEITKKTLLHHILHKFFSGRVIYFYCASFRRKKSHRSERWPYAISIRLNA